MKRIKSILANVLQIDEDLITDETSPENVEAWDSFNALLLISELEKAFNINFDINEVMSIKCVGDIKEILNFRNSFMELQQKNWRKLGRDYEHCFLERGKDYE